MPNITTNYAITYTNKLNLQCRVTQTPHPKTVSYRLRGQPFDFLRGKRAGEAGFQKKNILQTDFERKKNLVRKYLPYNGFVWALSIQPKRPV